MDLNDLPENESAEAPEPGPAEEPQSVPPAPSVPETPAQAYAPPFAMPPQKPKTDVGMFIFGFVSPWLVSTLLSFIVGIIANAVPASDGTNALAVIISYAAAALSFLLFFGFLALFLMGKKRGDVRMWSYGKGGMWSYAATVILVLLAFGTCAVFAPNLFGG